MLAVLQSIAQQSQYRYTGKASTDLGSLDRNSWRWLPLLLRLRIWFLLRFYVFTVSFRLAKRSSINITTVGLGGLSWNSADYQRGMAEIGCGREGGWKGVGWVGSECFIYPCLSVQDYMRTMRERDFHTENMPLWQNAGSVKWFNMELMVSVKLRSWKWSRFNLRVNHLDININVVPQKLGL